MWRSRPYRYALAAVVSCAALVYAFRARPVAVDAAVAAFGPIEVTIDEEGRTRVRERFVVAAPVAGRLRRIARHEGDRVDAGAILAILDPPPLDRRAAAEAKARLGAAEASRDAARAREASARAALEQAHRDRERAERLGREGLAPAEDLERAALAETTANADLAAARKAVDAAIQTVAEVRATRLAESPESATGVASTPVLAEVPGTLLRVLQESDRVVAAGTPLFELGDLQGLEVVAELLSSDAASVREGAPLWIGGLGSRGEVRGRVRRVEPSGFTKVSALGVEEQRVRVLGEFETPPEGLGDGYRVDLRIVVSRDPRALVVPASALFRSGSEWRVFVIEEGRARSLHVDVGRRNRASAEILAGLSEGARVVLYPDDRIRDGVRVR